MPIIYPNGTGESTGCQLAITKPVYMSGNIWYVHYATGTDAASPAGRNRESPLKTLAQAVTNSSARDWIVLMNGHEETVSTNVQPLAGTRIVGGGLSSGVPGAILKFSGSGLITLSNADTQVHGVRFTSDSAGFGNRIIAQQTNVGVYDCRFEMGKNDASVYAMSLAGVSGIRIERCTFVSVSTGIEARPAGAIFSNSASGSQLRIVDCVFDGGELGWTGAAIDTSQSITDVSIHGISLLNGSDVTLNSSTTGHLIPTAVTGGSRISW